MLTSRGFFYASLITLAFLGTACNNPSPQNATSRTEPAYGRVPSALPDNGFKAQIELANPPAKLRAGEKVNVEVQVRNASDVVWYPRGAAVNTSSDNKFYLAAANRWLQPDGKLITNMDGRYGLDKNLKPGEQTTVPLQVTAPKDPGEYLLEVDLVQEQVSWFSDKGSPTARTKVTVVR